jgi:hypothetical protein
MSCYIEVLGFKLSRFDLFKTLREMILSLAICLDFLPTSGMVFFLEVDGWPILELMIRGRTGCGKLFML